MSKARFVRHGLNALRHPLTPILTVGLTAGLVVAWLTGGPSQPNESSAVAEQVISRLNELQSHLKSVEAVAVKPQPVVDLSGFEERLGTISQEVAALRHFNPDELKTGLEHRLSQAEDSLSQQLHTLSGTLNELQAKTQAVKYLPLKALPFAVMSIDSIQNMPVASLHYDYKTIPVEKGDALAGWKVVSVDFRHQTIEFENKNKERVRVQQDHIG
ncbi:hypothetical protein [Legionella fairfieldensis]|uniref:hypothetical protein n=1 Tax=Legionella fairfieldensis TaxID=45064 RepID=UPI0006883FF6|nr:hypothetical protein [Legionella fairfieldensis]